MTTHATNVPTTPQIDGERLWSSLMEMARIGPSPNGGSRRLALSDEDLAGRQQLLDWAALLGCEWQMDQAGNMFIYRLGRDNDLSPVAIGSHLDSQPLGGRFDGVLGVLAGLEIFRTLNDQGITTLRPLVLVNWTNEEGSRFAPAMGGSGVYSERLSLEDFRAAEDRDGVSLGKALDQSGYQGSLTRHDLPLAAYLELHIEQGPILEKKNLPVGIVSGVQGLRWYDITFTGDSAHAGPTPMEYRHDPLMAATAFVEAMRKSVLDDADGASRLTIGDFRVAEPSRNVIPGAVTLQVDVRHTKEAALQTLDDSLRAHVKAAAEREGVSANISVVWHMPVTRFDEALVKDLSSATEALGHVPFCMMSGAGHDAVNISYVTPTAMLFIPCRDGISHNERECAEPEHCAIGAQVLCDALLRTANRE
ncbi:Zn-dependent hydrolase [Marinobacter sp. M3C]|uniref:Zn-dependent hydrolase n=1 Tax=unclassified Marinobacter TaxID=83889 RepID=UPI00200BB29C|nr:MULTISPECIES: Zn-dependent hydrolase [unclassified Marinobacter]MCL1478735.1 Zn-dependent hydrolase [Marinobacter sp.]MCL1481785.1 Zn-dependent hydrolase [Marinobacter sp.]MCL1484494.1 Zn-dependent hydrolase [Marinobacter sp.]UQG54936.1 Zn-dependent hydrolase [Marinobacter sp. M4C]UQG59690.1 Zn-dependent hydrolase [Marinobacter sp. M3C]